MFSTQFTEMFALVNDLEIDEVRSFLKGYDDDED